MSFCRNHQCLSRVRANHTHNVRLNLFKTLPQGRASNEVLVLPFLQHHTFSPNGVAGLCFTAGIGRAQFHRARSASKKDGGVRLTIPATWFPKPFEGGLTERPYRRSIIT